jgi:hypothetical protein
MLLLRQASQVVHRYGRFKHLSLVQWFGKVESQPATADTGELFDMPIVSMDIAGRVTAVKVVDLYQRLHFTDLLTMVEIDGRWVIANMPFHHD